MKFKVEITDSYIKMAGTKDELLAGLALYIKSLEKNGISDSLIKIVIDMALEKNSGIDETLKNAMFKNIEVDKSKTNNEELKKMLDKEFKNLFD